MGGELGQAAFAGMADGGRFSAHGAAAGAFAQSLIRTRRGAAAGEWHWHGSAPGHFMAHLSITEGVAPGDPIPETDWGGHVTDEEYQQR